MDIKQEFYFLDLSSKNENESFIQDSVREVKIETNDSDIKPELEEDSTCCTQHHLMRFNETIKESEIDTKIDIKEEHSGLERASCVHDDIKDEKHEDFYSTKPPGVYKEGAPSYTSDLFSSEDFGHDKSFNMKKDGPEPDSSEKYQSHKCVIGDIPSIDSDSSIYSETSDNGEIVGMASPSKQRPEYSSHLEKYRQTLDSKGANDSDLYDNDLNQLSSVKSCKLIDEGKRTHKCIICNRAFTTLSNLKRHQLLHDGLRPYKCNICSKDFTESSHLKRHQLIHERLKPHKLIHEGTKPHKCNICNKAFTHLSSFKTHKLIHEGIKPHKCNICNKAFTMLLHWKRHKWIHEGIKPHKCKICNKAFTQLSDWKRHKLIHEGIKPHKCNKCNKAFTQLQHWKRHQLIHEDIKPHKCSVCSKAFSDLSNLKRHRLIHEDLKSQKCNICSKVFPRLSSLKRHKLIHNNTV